MITVMSRTCPHLGTHYTRSLITVQYCPHCGARPSGVVYKWLKDYISFKHLGWPEMLVENVSLFLNKTEFTTNSPAAEYAYNLNLTAIEAEDILWQGPTNDRFVWATLFLNNHSDQVFNGI